MSVYKPGRPSKYNPASDTGKEPPHRPGEYRIRSTDSNIEYRTMDGRSASHTRPKDASYAACPRSPISKKEVTSMTTSAVLYAVASIITTIAELFKSAGR